MRSSLVVLLTMILATVAPVFADAPPAANSAQSGNTILTEASWWQCLLCYRTPVVRHGEELAETKAIAFLSLPTIAPENWAQPDFDDSSWSHCRFPLGNVMVPGNNCFPAHGFLWSNVLRMDPVTSRQCLRGRFKIDDPAQVGKLTLSLGYRGGAAVYVNGREIARGNLPKAPAALTDATLADDYPPLVFVGADEVPIQTPGNKAPKENLDQRVRALDNIAIPADCLRKGVNVLGIDTFRSPYFSYGLDKENLNFRSVWATCGLVKLSLVASGPAGLGSDAPPKGLRVSNLDRNDRIGRDSGQLAPGSLLEPLRPITIVGARNGYFSGQLAVSSTEAIRGLNVRAAELKGPGSIPESAFTVRYALIPKGGWADTLESKPPAEVAVVRPGAGSALQVLLTVHVPADAPAGKYAGSLSVSAEGSTPINVPVELTVADWNIPDPANFRTFVGCYESPTSVAMQYKVAEWSEPHWKLLEKSFELLGQIGNKSLQVPVVDRTQLGNDEGMVYWVRKADGSFDYDFTMFDRYIKLAKKYCGTLDYVVLYVWHGAGWQAHGTNEENTVTVVNAATGKHEELQVPEFGSPEAKKFWTPVINALKEHLAKEGEDKGMCLGTLSDSTAPKPVFTMFDEIMPGIAWQRGCHTMNPSTKPYFIAGQIGKVILHEHCYGMTLADATKPVPSLWSLRGNPGTAYFRGDFDCLSLMASRTTGERALFTNKQGVGRFCLDFWNVLVHGNGQKPAAISGAEDNVYNRWLRSTCSQREPTVFRMTSPGSDGAVPTLRFEALREGLQESEAAIIISEAIEKHADRLGDKAAVFRQLLAERLNDLLKIPEMGHGVMDLTLHMGWQERNTRLFAAATEAAKVNK